MADTYLGQIYAPDSTGRLGWQDYARGQEAESIAWAEQDPSHRRIVDWIDKGNVIWPKPKFLVRHAAYKDATFTDRASAEAYIDTICDYLARREHVELIEL